MKLIFIEMVEFNGAHGAKMIQEFFPKIFPIFEKLVATRKSLRVSNPALLLRSFFGMIVSFYITGAVINNSTVTKFMPIKSADAYVDIFLHGIINPES